MFQPVPVCLSFEIAVKKGFSKAKAPVPACANLGQPVPFDRTGWEIYGLEQAGTGDRPILAQVACLDGGAKLSSNLWRDRVWTIYGLLLFHASARSASLRRR